MRNYLSEKISLKILNDIKLRLYELLGMYSEDNLDTDCENHKEIRQNIETQLANIE